MNGVAGGHGGRHGPAEPPGPLHGAAGQRTGSILSWRPGNPWNRAAAVFSSDLYGGYTADFFRVLPGPVSLLKRRIDALLAEERVSASVTEHAGGVELVDPEPPACLPRSPCPASGPGGPLWERPLRCRSAPGVFGVSLPLPTRGFYTAVPLGPGGRVRPGSHRRERDLPGGARLGLPGGAEVPAGLLRPVPEPRSLADGLLPGLPCRHGPASAEPGEGPECRRTRPGGGSRMTRRVRAASPLFLPALRFLLCPAPSRGPARR
ncbi:MAG: hypothetical protein M0C28_43620 [Candidatus Moduliflexus flocculans]|nr:hypothetical protein [Candidatus Moduliflexus flocculans]